MALELQGRGFATTAITAFELWAGARAKGEREKVERLLSSMHVPALDQSADRLAGEAHSNLARKGTPIGMGDSLIAAICLAKPAVLPTLNRAHFERVEGLSLGRLTL